MLEWIWAKAECDATPFYSVPLYFVFKLEQIIICYAATFTVVSVTINKWRCPLFCQIIDWWCSQRGFAFTGLVQPFVLHFSYTFVLSLPAFACHIWVPHPRTLSCPYHVTLVSTWVGKCISVTMPGDCRSQGCHGYQHAWLASCTAPPNQRHLTQAHLLATSLKLVWWLMLMKCFDCKNIYDWWLTADILENTLS